MFKVPELFPVGLRLSREAINGLPRDGSVSCHQLLDSRDVSARDRTHRAYRREGSPRDRRTDRVKDLVGERAIFDGPREDHPAH